ncbi:uncharacterized protein LOC116250866 [Nymphaea colorata]|nr:uncharacterized protein LOC116250866 [Nymphaea colorata]
MGIQAGAAADSAAPPEPPPPPPAPLYFPLRWESTGDQWWYATPVDLAAANGHYELVRALLVADSNLLIKLTSLRRIRRLETVWDDHPDFLHAPRGRAAVARGLLHDCETRNGNSLIRAGYGGWLLYTAAAAGDGEFIQDLLRREPFLVFGEGEYGVTDMLYAAARSKNSEVFRLLLDAALTVVPMRSHGRGAEVEEVFRMEVMSRAVHAAARGGNWEVLRELLLHCGDVLAWRDIQGSTVLHAAAGRGRVEVVKNMIESFDVIGSKDNHGNTPLHLSAYRGHLEVVKVLVLASPSLASVTNDAGDTFLHMTIAGFQTPGFHRLDRQIELMKELVSGKIVCLPDIINFKNNEGRTALHLAVIGNIHCDLVELLMEVSSIDLNVRDFDGLTPLDLLNLRPRSACSEILKKQLTSAGGTSNSRNFSTRGTFVSQLKMQGIACSSPGTCFRITDSEIFLCAGSENMHELVDKGCSVRSSSCSNSSKSELSHLDMMDMNFDVPVLPKSGKSISSAAKRLRSLLGWSHKKEKASKPGRERQLIDDGIRTELKHSEEESVDEKRNNWYDREDTPTPLRQRFSNASLPNNKRTLAVRTTAPSPSAKKKFATGLRRGVIQGMPHLVLPFHSPSKCSSKPSTSSPPSSERMKGVLFDHEIRPSFAKRSVNAESRDKLSSSNKRVNQYLCFGAHAPFAENQMTNQQGNCFYRRSIISEA